MRNPMKELTYHQENETTTKRNPRKELTCHKMSQERWKRRREAGCSQAGKACSKTEGLWDNEVVQTRTVSEPYPYYHSDIFFLN
jgi:hypothetical protein